METLINNQKSLMISSLSKDNNPEISYAPFVMVNDKIYTYLSKAANHYYNLRDKKEKQAFPMVEAKGLEPLTLCL